MNKLVALLVKTFPQFFENIGQGKLQKSSIAAILIMGTSPVPLVACLLIYAMSQAEVGKILDMYMVYLFYKVAFIFSALCVALALLGLWVRHHQNFSSIYIFVLAQVFGIGTFSLCFFLGAFTSPILLTILMSTGIGAVIFDKRQLLSALMSILVLASFTAYLQASENIKVLPIAKSMELAELYLFDWYLYVYALLIPLLSTLFSLIVRALMQEYRHKYQEVEALANKLAKYLSPQVYTSIFAGDKDFQSETYRKKLTVFFSDLKGFTGITDDLNSEQLSRLLNGYLDLMSKIALRHGGTIDKFVGDSIMIFFGDPDSQGEKEDALRCVRMALEMREAVHMLEQEWQEQGVRHPIQLRVGINTGYCTVGNFGSDNRVDYTIIGGQVNLASRLLYASEGDRILISHETYGLINDDINCVKKEKLSVKGIHRPIQSYEVQDSIGALSERQEPLEKQLTEFLDKIDFDRLNDLEKIKLLEHFRI